MMTNMTVAVLVLFAQAALAQLQSGSIEVIRAPSRLTCGKFGRNGEVES